MKKLLDSNMIKIIAIIAMSIDHITWMIYPGYPKEIIPVLLHIIRSVCLRLHLYRILLMCLHQRTLWIGNHLFCFIMGVL